MRLLVIGLFWYFFCFLILIFSFVYLSDVKQTSHKLSANLYVEAKNLPIATLPVKPTSETRPAKDIRIIALTAFLDEYKSPLVELTETLVKQADLWGIDYALIPAIAMQESGGCKKIPAASYNCWGFGIYGEKVVKFSSYEEAIAQVAKTIKETYIKNGLTNVTLLEDRWAPQSRGQWSTAVNFFIGKIREYERNIPNI